MSIASKVYDSMVSPVKEDDKVTEIYAEVDILVDTIKNLLTYLNDIEEGSPVDKKFIELYEEAKTEAREFFGFSGD